MIHLTLRPDPAITQRHIGLPNRRGTFINEARRIADSDRKLKLDMPHQKSPRTNNLFGSSP
jgi:hypothetical protein